MVDRYRDRPHHADDQYNRGTQHAPHQGDGDPLAELARLIGQTDPFSGFGREQQPAAAHRDAYNARDEFASEPDSYDEMSPGPPPWVRHNQQVAVEPAGPRYADEPHYEDQQSAAPWEESPARGYDHEPRFDQPRFEQPRTAYEEQSTRYDDVLYGQPHDDRAQDLSYGHDQGYADQGYADPDGYAGGDEAYARKPRRGGTMTVMVVLALAVLGTAGAYAYRSLTGGAARSGEPPVIKADAGPNKVVPPAPSGEGKQIYDRVGEKSGERVVSREEQPVDVNGKTGPRIVFPPLAQNNSPPSAAAVSPSGPPIGAGTGNGTLGGAEPRKIRTLSIRPDQTDTTSAAPIATPAAVRTVPMAAQRNPQPAPVATASNGNGPMALSPEAQNQLATREPRSHVASVNPAVAAPSGGNGAYVQVSSQKSEADAKNSYRILQGKYPGILGSRSPAIRRADLGSKGVFYRALVGPFGTNDEATQFCVNLQSAGGKCLIQRN